MLKWSLVGLSVMIVLGSMLVFLYGTIKLARAQQPTPQVDVGVEGFEMVTPEEDHEEMQQFALQLLAGSSAVGFLALLGLIYALRMPQGGQGVLDVIPAHDD